MGKKAGKATPRKGKADSAEGPEAGPSSPGNGVADHCTAGEDRPVRVYADGG